MTETDATRRPLTMPTKFIPYLDKHRIYRMFKDMLSDLIVTLPRDHLKHMKMFLRQHLNSTHDTNRIVILVSPELNIDIKRLVKELIKDHGFFVITRRFIMDKYEAHDDYEPGCISPELMSEVTKILANKEPVRAAGWLMFDHPCTLREARCLQQDGVLPTVTLMLTPPPTTAPQTVSTATPKRGFFQQDFEGLKYAYKATLKEVHVSSEETFDTLVLKCYNAIQASAAGAQGPGQGFNVVGAPGVYRVLLVGPTGSGRKTHAKLLARHFGLVYLDFDKMLNEAQLRNDDLGVKLRSYGPSLQTREELLRRRLEQKDCVDQGWVMVGYPNSSVEFDKIDNMDTSQNRIIILNTDPATCKKRCLAAGVDWCTGEAAPVGSGPRVIPTTTETDVDAKLETFSEQVAELRAAAGITAVEIDTGNETIEETQVKIQAAVIMAPAYDIVSGSQLRNVRGD